MLLFIDNRRSDISFLVHRLESQVTVILYDFWEDTFDSLASKIPIQSYKHMAILQENASSMTYFFLHSFGESVLHEIETVDSQLESWTSFYLFLELCVSRLEITTLDILDGFPSKNWDYLSESWNIPICHSELYSKDSTELLKTSVLERYFKPHKVEPDIPSQTTTHVQFIPIHRKKQSLMPSLSQINQTMYRMKFL